MNVNSIQAVLSRFGLVEWFASAFSDDEQKYMATMYQPAGSRAGQPLVEGDDVEYRQSPVSFLTGLASFVCDEEHLSIAERVFDKAQSMDSDDMDVLDRHCMLSEMIRIYDPLRKQEPYQSRALDACRRQIAISREAAIAWRMTYNRFSNAGSPRF